MECADVHAPKLVAIANGDRAAPVKIGSDNPDNLYQSATISGKIVYRVKVKRGTVAYLGFGTQSGSYGAPGGLSTVDYKEAVEFEMDKDGNFEIVVSSEENKPAGCKNWMKTLSDPESAMLIVRQTYNDHDNEIPATVTIEKLEGQTLPTPVTCEQVDEALKKSALFVGGASFMFARWAKGFQKHVNELPLFDQEVSNKAGGDPNIRYFHSYWRLADDECLVISATPPKVETWNFQLNNHWMESLDYRYYQIHVNMHMAHYRKDKSIRIVIAHSNPAELGLENADAYDWINTTGKPLSL
uniref:Uncharacterized protein n=2 Tax=Aplanochytrium stocchinoi TaxID=215587 RepID=A0A7S3V099_9STRA